MLQDLRYACRMLIKAPGFTLVAVLTLALGIGANTAIFSLLDAVLLRPLQGVSQPQQLVLLTDPNSGGTSFGTTNGTRGMVAYSEYLNLRDNNQVFSGLLATDSQTEGGQVDWSPAGAAAAPEKAQTQMVSANYFAVLGATAWRGRLFAANEGSKDDADPIAVMNYAYWNQRFARDPGVVGKPFRIHGHVFTVIGVTPSDFAGTNVGAPPDLWIPITMAPTVIPGMDRLHDPQGVSRVMWLEAIGRLKPGVTLTQASQNANLIFQRSVEQQAGAASDAQTRKNLMQQKLELTSGATGTSPVRGQFGDPLLALLALVGLVLLAAVVNLASLLLARAAARQKEMGVRIALGAGRSRIVRQLLTESVLVSCIGGLVGVLLAIAGNRFLIGMVAPPESGIRLDLAPDWRVFGFVGVLCVLAGVLFGLAPALRMARLDLNATLQAQGRGGSGRTRHVFGRFIKGGLPLGKLLVIGQVALSVMLVVGASLFVRSLQKLQAVPLGYSTDHLSEFYLDLSTAGYKGADATAAFHRLLDQASALPGVRAVAASGDGLFEGNNSGLPVAIQGYTATGSSRGVGIGFDQVSSAFFQTVGVPILLGRALTPQDDSGAVKNVVINQTAETRFFAGRNPLGMQIHDLYPDDKNAVYNIVGVCADMKLNSLDEKPRPMFYVSFFNGIGVNPNGVTDGIVLVRAAGAAGSTDAGLRNLIRNLNPNIQLPTFQTMGELVSQSLVTQQLLARLSGFFGLLALLLAAIGLYGVMAYTVTRRTPEIGVRMALGAGRGTVIGMILGETALILAFGLLLGIPASLGGAKVIASQISLFGLKFTDPASLAAATIILAVVAALAGLIPAHHASRVDPLTALREE